MTQTIPAVTGHPDRETVLATALAGRDLLVAYGYACTGDWSVAEDAVQEAFLFAVDRWSEVKTIAGVLPWLRAVVRNKCYEIIRRSGRHAALPEDDRLAEIARIALDDDGNSSVSTFGARRSALHRCLSGLSEPHRALLQAFYWRRSSCETLAKQLGRSGESIRAVIHRLRLRLRACIERHLVEATL
ncbi:hypothetical protein LBMAG53_12840 [Planctomycetota bacterium]|nr:hypothetical protein LBMAG53_12840 [Planctomycetota bacterium]